MITSLCICVSGFLPPMALVNFLCPGDVPVELQDLTRVEVTLIALYNPVMTLALVATSGHSVLKDYRFSVVNDVAHVTTQLPAEPSLDTICILRCVRNDENVEPAFESQRNELTFRHAKVHTAW